MKIRTTYSISFKHAFLADFMERHGIRNKDLAKGCGWKNENQVSAFLHFKCIMPEEVRLRLLKYLGSFGEAVGYDQVFPVEYEDVVGGIRRDIDYRQLIGYQQLPSPFDDARINEAKRKIREIVESFPEREQRIYQLRFVEGRKYKDIAAEVNLSVERIRDICNSLWFRITRNMGSDYEFSGEWYC